ncbi:MAG: Lon protease family protein [Anaerolineae bacterium]
MAKTRELAPEQLRRVCDPQQFNFQSTADLPPLTDIIGQDRAVRAVAFGIGISSPGYHMYALGPTGTGKTTTIKKFLTQEAARKPVPDDWCYVHNFAVPHQPRALRLPPGQGVALRDDMDRLIEELQTAIPRAFESEEYEKQKEQVIQRVKEAQAAEFAKLEEKAKKRGFALVRVRGGFVLAPAVEGQPLSERQLEQLTDEQREKLSRLREGLQKEIDRGLRRIRELEKETQKQVRQLEREIALSEVGHRIEELKEKYGQIKAVAEYLEAAQQDIVDHVELFKRGPQAQKVTIFGVEVEMPQFDLSFRRYKVNVLVDNSQTQGAPVVVESNPTYPNLIGRIEHRAQLGALMTDFTMIKPGALHRANGGYLVVEVLDVLRKPLAWEGLKRALKNQQIRTEEVAQELGLLSTVTLEPEPIPLDVKVVLIGNPLLYYLLYAFDEDFQELFKVKADFTVQMDWTTDAVEQYAQFIGTCCREENLKHFDPTGVAKVVEYGARLVGDQKKLATRFLDIADVIREASYWAGQNGHDLVTASDVRQAIEEKVYRSNRIEERIRELIEDGTLLIDTEGEVVGQVNGVSLVMLGDYAFGKPSRITARTFVGRSGVVDIERETEMSGRIHSKGVMILSGYLGGKYAQEQPLTLSASIAFEQLYEEVEGDSAASTELYALLSSLSGFPLKQGLAVTGSVNQRGEVQAVGGVNRKIEGFFDVCRVKGLTGEQGVLIPAKNVKHLMLREDVVEAVKAGKFHIYPVNTIDEGIEILTGVPAGEPQEDGTYPEGTVNGAVQRRLRELAEGWREFYQREGEEG